MSDDWRARANCRDVDPNVMQPEEAAPDELALAMSVCDGCPVRAQCRALAESQPGAYGVHAGQWYGDPPRNPAMAACQWCGVDMPRGERGTRVYCGGTCKKRAQRAKRAASSAA